MAAARSNRNTDLYNSLTDEELEIIVSSMIRRGWLFACEVDGQLTYRTTYAAVTKKTKAGESIDTYSQFPVLAEYPQALINKLGKVSAKILIHPVLWRYQHGGAEIDEKFEVSHRHAEQKVQLLCLETSAYNESRKGCHQFKFCCAKPVKHMMIGGVATEVRMNTACPHKPRCYCNNCGPTKDV